MYSGSASYDDELEAKRNHGIINQDKYKRSVTRTARLKGEGDTIYKGTGVPENCFTCAYM